MGKKNFLYVLFIGMLLGLAACTEPYTIETVGYERILVVEGTLTDEVKLQRVKLSRTTPLEDVDIAIEENANVLVRGDNGSEFQFFQDETGDYVSAQPFAALPNVQYTLHITTRDGKLYKSSAVSLPPAVEIGELYAERIVNPNEDKDGVQVLVNTEDPTGQAKYFRYEYAETYKVVAPYPSPYYVEIVNYNPGNETYDVLLTPRTPEEVCYSTETSTGIVQTATTEFSENRVVRFPVRYLSKVDARIQTRYSILVKQYVQSLEAYTFYKTVKELGSVQSLLSQGQPGYVMGNMVAEADPEEKVLGFFEASSMASKRIYFNYEDFGLEKPPYFVNCEVLVLDYYDATTLDNDPNEREAFFQLVSYSDYQVLSATISRVYRIVAPECAVCTYFSSNVKPDFWED